MSSTPKAEMVLAEIIANAKGAGMRAWKGSAYNTENPTTATACCAIGAWWLTHMDSAGLPKGISSGNDGLDYDPKNLSEDYLTGFTIGAAFQEAMSDD